MLLKGIIRCDRLAARFQIHGSGKYQAYAGVAENSHYGGNFKNDMSLETPTFLGGPETEHLLVAVSACPAVDSNEPNTLA